jgi:zinc transporter ZupT
MSEILGVILLVASVFLGGAMVVFLHKVNRGQLIKLLLSLSGGFLLAIAFVHFIPEIYVHNGMQAGYYILLGFLIQLFLEYFTGGIEHGHMHIQKPTGAMPWALFLALSIHSFIEGIPLEGMFHGDATDMIPMVSEGHDHLHGHTHGFNGSNGLLFGIILHKIPVAIALMTMLLASGFTKIKAWVVMAVFSLMAPLGLVFGHFGLSRFSVSMELVLAVVVGMFLHISTTIIFEAAENHKFNFVKFISLLIGVGIALLIN